ncbi:hypothetical protein MSAN_01911800 [Mycena sanguinolenta]|uniref:Uncharacterized protein n=1 Tax=Mycena sanguinolenta TaxID=230812 RepID=A0A8H6XPD5_9AGAR|nr:hypothetical protein MSAN_01911800 [Mycena sanguinolenta]
MVPPVKRTLFAQDYNEDELIRPVYNNNDRKAFRDLQRTPPESPLAKFNHPADVVSPSTRSESSHEQSSTDSTPEPDSPVLTLPSRWERFSMIPDGLGMKRALIRALNTDQAMEITCTFNPAKLVYMQHVRFALGGAHQFPSEWEDSPKSIQAAWGTHMSTPEQPGLPDWAALNLPIAPTYRFELKVVTLEYTVRRIARLAFSSWNAILAKELLLWAERINPLARRLDHPFLPPISGPPTPTGHLRYSIPELESDEE